MRYFMMAMAVLASIGMMAPEDAAAQDAPPPPPPPVEELDAPEDGEEPQEAAEEQETEAQSAADTGERVAPFTVGRAAVETLTGFGMMVGATLAGSLTGFLVGSLVATPGSVEVGVATGIGALVGYGVGTPFGIWMGGNAMDGNGSLWATVGGTASGILVGGAMTGVIATSTGGNGGAAAWLTILPVAGGIVGYELTSGPPTQPDSGVSLRIGATPPVDGRGTMINLSGRW